MAENVWLPRHQRSNDSGCVGASDVPQITVMENKVKEGGSGAADISTQTLILTHRGEERREKMGRDAST